MKRNAPYLLLAPVLMLSMVVGYAGGQAVPAAGRPSAAGLRTNGAGDPLLFPKDKYAEETRTVKTSFGEKKVTVHSYAHIPYVTNPADKDYQSLDVTVPVQVDGKAVDAAHAPMLLTIGVGGYMSASNTGRAGPGGPVGGPPNGRIGGPPAGRGMGGPGRGGNISRNSDLALAAGYVVVSPGCRGRDNRAADGTYYGKAPAAIVDLKAAVRYVRHNAGVMPGNVNWIVTTGVSAGGALSALLGASGNSRLYDAYLKEIGAADADDAIFASADFCPIMDLDHADMAYEWMYGTVPTRSGLVNQELSKQLKDAFVRYQTSLRLQGKNGFGTLTADNYTTYLLKTYLFPSANKYLRGLTEEKRRAYLANNQWLAWSDKGAIFTFTDGSVPEHLSRRTGR